jgi:hypothetical protein
MSKYNLGMSNVKVNIREKEEKITAQKYQP